MSTAIEVMMKQRAAEAQIRALSTSMSQANNAFGQRWMDNFYIEGECQSILDEAKAGFDKIKDDLAWWEVAHETKMIQLRGKYGLPLFL